MECKNEEQSFLHPKHPSQALFESVTAVLELLPQEMNIVLALSGPPVCTYICVFLVFTTAGE